MEKEIILDGKKYFETLAIISPRELQIIEHLSNGLNSAEIGKELGISLKTVEVHRHNILKKTGHKNVVHLIASFLRKGLIK